MTSSRMESSASLTMSGGAPSFMRSITPTRLTTPSLAAASASVIDLSLITASLMEDAGADVKGTLRPRP